MGLEPIEVENKLSQLLIVHNYFPADSLQLSVQILEWAPIQVSVTGELFQPGRVLINEGEKIQLTAISPESLQVTGDYPTRRYLSIGSIFRGRPLLS